MSEYVSPVALPQTPFPGGLPAGLLRVPGGYLQLRFGSEADIDRYMVWAKTFRPEHLPIQLDAFEYAALAFRRWKEARSKHRAVSSFPDLLELVRDNPHAEVACLVMANVPRLATGSTVGICYLRRTWCNNVCVEFLTRHPRYAKTCPVKGVGTALLFAVCCLAESLGCGEIWAEATQNSVDFYRKAFKRPEFKDLMRIPAGEYREFASQARAQLLGRAITE